jgi:hypothetical protein
VELLLCSFSGNQKFSHQPILFADENIRGTNSFLEKIRPVAEEAVLKPACQLSRIYPFFSLYFIRKFTFTSVLSPEISKKRVMKKNIRLENFEYKIFDLNVGANHGPALRGKSPSSLLQLRIDFADRELSMKADSRFIAQYRLNEGRSLQFAPGNQVNMTMDILPARTIGLNDIHEGSMVFHLCGSMVYGSTLVICDGILTVKNKKPDELWELSFHIYDDSIEFGEIKFELPLIHVNDCLLN